VAAHVLKLSDAAGLLRGNPWAAGQSDAGPPNAVPSISQQRQTATPTAVTGEDVHGLFLTCMQRTREWCQNS
jgi:hypothetical protein